METFPSKSLVNRFFCLLVLFPVWLQAGQAELDQIEADHGLSLAISGMIIVFLGLLSISGFIAVLPFTLSKLLKKPEPRPAPLPMAQPVSGLDPATLTAIAMVIHAEAERASGQGLKVTLPLTSSPWALSSQMRVLPSRIQS